MARLAGRNLYVDFNDVVLVDDFRSGNEEESVNLIDASAGDDVNSTFVVGHASGTFSLDFLDTEDHAAYTACAPGTTGTLRWGPQGNAAGASGKSVIATIESRSRSKPYQDIVAVSVTFQYNDPDGVQDITF